MTCSSDTHDDGTQSIIICFGLETCSGSSLFLLRAEIGKEEHVTSSRSEKRFSAVSSRISSRRSVSNRESFRQHSLTCRWKSKLSRSEKLFVNGWILIYSSVENLHPGIRHMKKALDAIREADQIDDSRAVVFYQGPFRCRLLFRSFNNIISRCGSH
jgi:hypothetical protein